MSLIVPYQKDDALLADIRRTADHDGCHVWWLGQSGFLLQCNGKHLLFDPYLSDSLTKKYAATDKPHTRMSERVIDPARLDLIDVVTSSHNHTDHLDAETLLPLFAANPGIQFVFPEANRKFITERLGSSDLLDFASAVGERSGWHGLTDNQALELSGFNIHGVPAAHNDLERDEQGRPKFMGFVVECRDGTGHPFRLYHSGDTLWYDGMVELLKPFRLDVAFLPINGNKPERRVAGNLSAEEAARLGKEIGAKLVIPHHYDLFEFNTEDPAEFVYWAGEYETPHVVLKLGGRAEILKE